MYTSTLRIIFWGNISIFSEQSENHKESLVSKIIGNHIISEDFQIQFEIQAALSEFNLLKYLPLDVNFPVIFWLQLSEVTRWYLCMDWQKISMIVTHVVLILPTFWMLNSRVATCAKHRPKACYITYAAFIFENDRITTYVIRVILNCFARMCLSCPRESYTLNRVRSFQQCF